MRYDMHDKWEKVPLLVHKLRISSREIPPKCDAMMMNVECSPSVGPHISTTLPAWCGQPTKPHRPTQWPVTQQGYPCAHALSWSSKTKPHALPQGTYRFRVDRMYGEQHSGKYGEILPQPGDRCADSGE